MTDLENKEIFICHHCIDYKTYRRKDISNHLNRIYKCMCNNNNILFDDAKILSLHSRYIFSFDEKNLSKDDFIFIVNNYNDKKNYIHQNFKNIHNINSSDIDSSDIDSLNDNSLNNIVKDPITNKFECVKCKTSYTSKQNLIKHLLNKKLCDKNKKINEILESNKL